MKKRVAAALAALCLLVFVVGCSTHSPYWNDYQLTTYNDGYRWVDGVADMGGDTGELTLYYLTLADEEAVEIVCSLARDQMRGNAVIYWENPEGELTALHDMSGWASGSGTGSYTLPQGTSRFLVRADSGKYDVGMGLSGLTEENVLYLKEIPPEEDTARDGSLPPLGQIQ